MIKKIIFTFAILLCIVSCRNPLFFGGKVVGPYMRHFNNQLECAFVDGWETRKCLCNVINNPEVSGKVFIVAEDKFCESGNIDLSGE